ILITTQHFQLKTITNPKSNNFKFKGKKRREGEQTQEARIKSKRNGVNQPTPLVLSDGRRESRTEPSKIGPGIVHVGPLVTCPLGRERMSGKVGRALDPEREPSEEKEDGEKEREGVGLLEEVEER
ncbi:hypothetical protein PanWU01x14_249390, partial [Parasponia andersonii]